MERKTAVEDSEEDKSDDESFKLVLCILTFRAEPDLFSFQERAEISMLQFACQKLQIRGFADLMVIG